MKILAYLVTFIGVLALIIGLALLLAFPLMWAINWLFAPAALVALFGVAKLTFWRTVVLSIVTSSLFRGTSTSTRSK